MEAPVDLKIEHPSQELLTEVLKAGELQDVGVIEGKIRFWGSKNDDAREEWKVYLNWLSDRKIFIPHNITLVTSGRWIPEAEEILENIQNGVRQLSAPGRFAWIIYNLPESRAHIRNENSEALAYLAQDGGDIDTLITRQYKIESFDLVLSQGITGYGGAERVWEGVLSYDSSDGLHMQLAEEMIAKDAVYAEFLGKSGRVDVLKDWFGKLEQKVEPRLNP